jgi:hypothetical protein
MRGFEPNGPVVNEQQLANFVTHSDVGVCLQFKKGLTGRKAFMKSVGLFHLHEKYV